MTLLRQNKKAFYLFSIIVLIFVVFAIFDRAFIDRHILLENRDPIFYNSLAMDKKTDVIVPVNDDGSLNKNLLIYSGINYNKNVVSIHTDYRGGYIHINGQISNEPLNVGYEKVYLPDGKCFFNDGGASRYGAIFLIWSNKLNSVVADGNIHNIFSIDNKDISDYYYVLTLNAYTRYNDVTIKPMVTSEESSSSEYVKYKSFDKCPKCAVFNMPRDDFDSLSSREKRYSKMNWHINS